MKGILLCGGRGTRLQPFTYYCNKHLLPLYNVQKPIIKVALETLKKTGILDVAIVLGDFRCEDIFSYLKDGSQYGMKFTYYWQGAPLGIAHAVYCARDFISKEEGFFVYLGDNIFGSGIGDFYNYIYKNINKRLVSAGLLFAHSEMPQRFGCPKFEFVKNIHVYHPDFATLIDLVEKPANPESNLVISGFYYFNSELFLRFFKELIPSKRGEYELTDLLVKILRRYPQDLLWQIYEGFWSDAGTFESIKRVEEFFKGGQ